MKSKTMVLWSLVLAAGTVTATPTFAPAQEGRGWRGPRAGEEEPEFRGLRERMAERLGLTEDQQDKMRVIRLEQRKEQTLRRGKLAGLRSELQVEFMEAQVDRGRVLGLQGQISDLQATMARSRLEGRLDLLEVLSPEQRETWMEMRREAPGMFRRGMDRVRRHHPGRGFGWAPEAPGPGDDLGEAFDLEDLLLEDDLAR